MRDWTEDDFEQIRIASETQAGHRRGYCKIRHAPEGELLIRGMLVLSPGPGHVSLPCPPRPEDEKPVVPLPDFHFDMMTVPWFPR
jgi:hypothetical protein